MFDSSVVLAELDAVQLAAEVIDNQAVLCRAECRVLENAANHTQTEQEAC